jgi:hypothetical protein
MYHDDYPVMRYSTGGKVGGALGGVGGYALAGPLGGLVGGALGKAIGGLFGGGKKKKARKAAEQAAFAARMQNVGTLPASFTAQLPAANLPSLAARQPTTMPQQDWNRYGMGPEQQFFTSAPAAAPAAAPVATPPMAAMAPLPVGYAEGGLAVSHGRSDDVPALLSNKEYVIDAETMALLGNGDPDAGADMMDKWRVNIRKHKGKHLAKGEISPDARMPDDYLKVRRK